MTYNPLDDPEWKALQSRATNSLKHSRRSQKKRVREQQERLTDICRRLLIGIIYGQMPEAHQMCLKAEPSREHWAEAVLVLDTVTDEQGNELNWRRQLSKEDCELIAAIGIDLTECYAIPNDEVEVTWGC